MDNIKMKTLMTRIHESIQRGVDFLYHNQTLHGDFKTYISPDKTMRESCQYVSTTYITTFAVYSLGFVKDQRVRRMREKAVQFLIEEMEPPGIWRYFGTNRNIRLTGRGFETYTSMGIVPDLDDTACVSFCLKESGIEIPDNMDVFLNNRNAQGIYLTWLMDIPKRAEYSDKTAYLVPHENDISAGVNANVLLYLGENEYTDCLCRFLNRVVIENRIPDSFIYFPENGILNYLVSRAYYNGISGLEASKTHIVKRIEEDSKNENPFISPLTTAYTICTLINCNNPTLIRRYDIEYLLEKQNQEGCWTRERFCDGGSYYYGSEELTTAICLEALSRYERWLTYEYGTEQEKSTLL